MIPNPVNTIATYFAPRSSQYPSLQSHSLRLPHGRLAIAIFPPYTSNYQHFPDSLTTCNSLTPHCPSLHSHTLPFHGLSIFLPFSSFHLQLPRFPKHPHPRPLSNPLNISYNTNLPPRLDLQTRKDLDLASPNRKSSLFPAYTIINMRALTCGPSSPIPDPKSQK
jgi:hypothetical protein